MNEEATMNEIVRLKNRDVITLSNRDRDKFLDALENPPLPNKHLQQAFEEYDQRKSDNLFRMNQGLRSLKSS